MQIVELKVLFSLLFYSQCNVRRLVSLKRHLYRFYWRVSENGEKRLFASWLDGYLAACNSVATTGGIFLKFSIDDYYEICQDTSNSVKIGQKHRPFCMNIWAFFVLLLEAQQYGELIVVLPWQRFKYLLHCWQRRLCDNNTKGTVLCFRGNALNIYYIVGSNVYATTIQKEHSVVFPWQRFKYLLHCWQRRLCDNNTKGTHCCVSMATL